MLLAGFPQKHGIFEGIGLQATSVATQGCDEGAVWFDCATYRKLAKLNVFPSHGVFDAGDYTADVGRARHQRWIICLDRIEARPALGTTSKLL